jgi:hypothetical protein
LKINENNFGSKQENKIDCKYANNNEIIGKKEKIGKGVFRVAKSSQNLKNIYQNLQK